VNPTPAEGVAAWYEDKETALGEGREAGGADRSPRNSQEAHDLPPVSQPRQSQEHQEHAHQEADCARPKQDQGRCPHEASA
jgi:hypothetical protein